MKFYCHLFSALNRYFAYDYTTHILVALNSDAYQELLDFNNRYSDKTISNEELVNPKLKVYKKCNIFFHDNIINDNEVDITNLKTAYFSFPTVHRCNLSCSYCFADHGNNYKGNEPFLTTKVLKDIFEFVYYKQFPNCTRYRLDFVSGGEPLLNFHIIKDVVQIGDELNRITNKKLDVFLCTNGTINDPQIWSYINAHNISLGMSIDGNKDIQNSTRRYPDGTGSYDDVVNTLSYILNSDSLSDKTKSIWGLSVVNGKTKSLKEILFHHKSLGLKHLQMKLVRLEKDHDLAINAENFPKIIDAYKELVEYFIEQSISHDYNDLKLCLNDNDYFGKLVCRVLDGGRIYRRCLAGINKLSFDAQGNIYPCDSFIGMADFCLGNIYDGIVEEKQRMFLSNNVNVRPQCKRCWAKYICGGDCLHNSYLSTQNMLTPDPVFCSINKKLIEYALVLYFYIMKNQDLENLRRYIKIKKRFSY